MFSKFGLATMKQYIAFTSEDPLKLDEDVRKKMKPHFSNLTGGVIAGKVCTPEQYAKFERIR